MYSRVSLFKLHTMKELTPRKIFDYLDKNIVGQSEAKKAVSIAMRNRWRRQQLDPELRSEIYPKKYVREGRREGLWPRRKREKWDLVLQGELLFSILMIGPTGSGKTEIARRLSKLTDSPYIKVLIIYNIYKYSLVLVIKFEYFLKIQ